MISLNDEMEKSMWLPLYVARLTKQDHNDFRVTDLNNKHSGFLIGADGNYVIDYEKINTDASTVADNAVLAFRERIK